MSYVTYHIPANYTDAGRLFGLFPIHNTVEAAILAVPTLFLCFQLLPFALTTNIVITLVLVVPTAGFALIGLGDDSLSRFLIAWWRWKRGKRIITFRGTPQERNQLDAALVEVYRRKGITYDNQSLFEADGISYKPMPTRKDMLEVLSENPDAKNLALVESRFVTASAKRLGQATNVDLENPFVVIDTSEIGKDLLAAGTFTATDFCTEKCKESRVKKKALILDELWALIGASSNPQAAEFVLECFKTYRAFGAAVIGATQDLKTSLLWRTANSAGPSSTTPASRSSFP